MLSVMVDLEVLVKARTIQKTKTLYWSYVPDDHKCKDCKKTKHDGVNFKVNVSWNYKNVDLYCNGCRVKKREPKKNRELINLGFREYFSKAQLKLNSSPH